MKLTEGICLSVMAYVMVFSSPAMASAVDLTDFTPTYYDGSSWVSGVPAGWTTSVTSNDLSIGNGSTTGDGPHYGLWFGNSLSNFVATVTVSAASADTFSGTFGGFYVDTASGYYGLNFGVDTLAEQYGINGKSSVYSVDGSYDLTTAVLRLTRDNGILTAEYSADGTNFTTVYQVSGVTGWTKFDLASYGGASGLTATFSNLNVTALPAVPEPATWTMLIGGLALAGGLLRRWNRDDRVVLSA